MNPSPAASSGASGLLQRPKGRRIAPDEIKNITLDNPNIEKILELDKASRLDVLAITNDNSIVNIEIQLRNTGDIPHRAFYYLSNIASRSIKEGESYKKVSVIGIWILGENVTKRQNAISESNDFSAERSVSLSANDR